MVTDNLFVVKQAIGEWEASELGWHHRLPWNVVNDLVEMTGDLVWFTHAGNGENSAAHALVRTFPAACDKRNRNDWMSYCLREKWNDIADKLPELTRLAR